MFDSIRKAHPVIVILSLVLVYALWIGSTLWGEHLRGLFYFLQKATSGLILANLVTYLMMFILFGFLFLSIGRLRLRDLAILPARLPVGIAWMIGLWVVFQLVIVLVNLISGEPLRFHSTWSNAASIKAMAGVLIYYTFGVALFEEIVFRGFLVGQLYHYCPTIFVRTGMRTVYAIVLSSLLFGIGHLPQRLTQGFSFEELPAHALIIAAGGIYLSIIWLLTENLFVAVSMHALLDALLSPKHPPLLFETENLQIVSAIVSVGLLLAIMLWWIPAQRKKEMNRYSY